MRLFKTITEALSGDNIIAIITEFLTQTGDVSVDSTICDYDVSSPYVFYDFFARVYAVAVSKEEQ